MQLTIYHLAILNQKKKSSEQIQITAYHQNRFVIRP